MPLLKMAKNSIASYISYANIASYDATIYSNITAMLQKSAKNLYKPRRENPKCIVSEKIIYRTKKSKIGLALVIVL